MVPGPANFFAIVRRARRGQEQSSMAPMRVRFRKLTGKMDWAAYRQVTEDLRQQRGQFARPVPGDPGFALFETPKEVEAQDGEADSLQIEAMLLKGALHPTDLVATGKGWGTLSECPEFMDVCEELERRGAWRKKLYWPVIGLVALAMIAGLLWFSAHS